MTAAKKITVEIPLITEEDSIEKLIKDLKKGVPLGVKKNDLRRTRIYADRTRH